MRVEIDLERCSQVAKRLAELGIPEPVEPFSLASSEVTFDLATLNLILVAICHQTQSLRGSINGVELRGWDYLQSSFLAWAKVDGSRILPEILEKFSANDLRGILNCSDQLQDADVERRAAYIVECGEHLRRDGAKCFTDVYHRCGHRIATTENNLLNWLRELTAFDDPVRKKSLYLLGLNSATCQWTYEDGELLDSPVDYHEVRGHLRLRTVILADPELRRLVINGEAVDKDADIEIRTAVTQAISHIGKLSGFTPMRLHYSFWNIFRSICLRKKPCCEGAIKEMLRSEFQHMVDKACCFANCCGEFRASAAIDEHRFVTDWY